MKSLDEFKKYVEKMNNSIKKDFPTAEILTASEIIKKIKTLNPHGSKPSDSP
jgi:flagellar biosynthesis/type III secretory pathway protein FliH